MLIIYFLFPEQRLTSFLNDLLFAHSLGDVLTCTRFSECASYFPYRYMGANQNRCEGILSVVMANIVAANCTSIHFFIKQKVYYVLLSFEERFTRINDDSVSLFSFVPGRFSLSFFRSYPLKLCRLFSAITSCFVQPYIEKAEHLGIKLSITRTNYLSLFYI